MIHNYLLSLYADLQGHEKILSFLAQEPRHYDLWYALRTCMRAGKQKACQTEDVSSPPRRPRSPDGLRANIFDISLYIILLI